MHYGSAAFSTWQQTPASTIFDVTMQMDTIGSFRFTGAALMETDFSGDFTEFSSVDDGIVQWRTWLRSDVGHAGAVVASLEPGSVPAQIVGENVQGYALVAHGVDFYDAWMEMPSRR